MNVQFQILLQSIWGSLYAHQVNENPHLLHDIPSFSSASLDWVGKHPETSWLVRSFLHKF